MALSDVLADAAIGLTDGAKWYGAESHPLSYPDEVIEWVLNAARVLAVAAGAIQDGEPLPALPEIKADAETTFAGPQLFNDFWPLKTKDREPVAV